jgi:hypothetical protein
VIEIRAFRNEDPPRLAAVWRAADLGPAAMQPMTPPLLEACVFSKPYFDRRGLVVALDDGDLRDARRRERPRGGGLFDGRRRGDGLSRSSQQRQDRGDEDSNRHRAQTEVVERDSAGQTGRRGLPCVHGDLSKDWGRGIRNGGPNHQNRTAPTGHRPERASKKTRDSSPSDLGPERTDGIDASCDQLTPNQPHERSGTGAFLSD